MTALAVPNRLLRSRRRLAMVFLWDHDGVLAKTREAPSPSVRLKLHRTKIAAERGRRRLLAQTRSSPHRGDTSAIGRTPDGRWKRPIPPRRWSPGGYPGGGRSRWSSRPGHPRWTTSVLGPGTVWGPRLPRLHPAQKAPIRHHPGAGSLRLATNFLDESQIRASARVVHKHGVGRPST
jgi:hypothetical protein